MNLLIQSQALCRLSYRAMYFLSGRVARRALMVQTLNAVCNAGVSQVGYGGAF